MNLDLPECSVTKNNLKARTKYNKGRILCIATQELPDGNKNYDVNNCGTKDVFERKCIPGNTKTTLILVLFNRSLVTMTRKIIRAFSITSSDPSPQYDRKNDTYCKNKIVKHLKTLDEAKIKCDEDRQCGGFMKDSMSLRYHTCNLPLNEKPSLPGDAVLYRKIGIFQLLIYNYFQ